MTKIKENIITFLKWSAVAVIIGIILGLLGYLFHVTLEFATEVRMSKMYLVWLLPLSGVIIVALYKICGMEKNKGTNCVIMSVRKEDKPPLILAPLIFISTAITHLFGGSAGREGAALQMGGSVGYFVGDKLKLDEKDKATATMYGMSGAFSALFGTPVTASVFAMEITDVGVMQYCAIVPCVLCAVVGRFIVQCFGVLPTAYTVTDVPTLSVVSVLQTVALGILCAVVSKVFCMALHKTHTLYEKYIPNKFLSAVVGGLIVAVLTFVLGTGDYNGAGTHIIEKAISGKAEIYAFAVKILFTAITLGAGFKGGEIVPTLFIGATFGCAVSPLLGLAPSFGASLGMIALFCGVTNCPLSALVMSVELFGGQGFVLYMVAVAVSYMLSGYQGLYSSQKIIYSKTKME